MVLRLHECSMAPIDDAAMLILQGVDAVDCAEVKALCILLRVNAGMSNGVSLDRAMHLMAKSLTLVLLGQIEAITRHLLAAMS